MDVRLEMNSNSDKALSSELETLNSELNLCIL